MDFQDPFQQQERAREDKQGKNEDSDASSISSVRTRILAPAAGLKIKDKSQSPWDTTSSTVKKQHKQHCKDAKKATAKTVERTDGSITAGVFLSEERQHVSPRPGG